MATPKSGLHHQQVIASAKVGVNVCTEKPMATNWKDGLDMVNVCRKCKVNLFVIKQNRFNKTLQLVKKQIQRGRFGKIALSLLTFFGIDLKSIMIWMSGEVHGIWMGAL